MAVEFLLKEFVQGTTAIYYFFVVFLRVSVLNTKDTPREMTWDLSTVRLSVRDAVAAPLRSLRLKALSGIVTAVTCMSFEIIQKYKCNQHLTKILLIGFM